MKKSQHSRNGWAERFAAEQLKRHNLVGWEFYLLGASCFEEGCIGLCFTKDKTITVFGFLPNKPLLRRVILHEIAHALDTECPTAKVLGAATLRQYDSLCHGTSFWKVCKQLMTAKEYAVDRSEYRRIR